MTREELHEKILDAYEEYYYANISKDEDACSAWLEKVAPQLEDIL